MKLNDTYTIIDEIGAGGGGIVYKAFHERLKTYVVVKQIQEKVKGILEGRAEADILKRIKHTYLPRVYDFLEIDGEIYTVMDYVPGISLDKLLAKKERIIPKQVLLWANQLAEALAYLHQQNPPIIHSDIKPSNIMLTPDGNICLIDFNISLAFDSSMKTSTGISGGYSPPEQFPNLQSYQRFAGIVKQVNRDKETLLLDETEKLDSMLFNNNCASNVNTQETLKIEQEIGRGVDERSDIYSLGATLYHLLTGVKPNQNFEKTVPINQYNLKIEKGFLVILNKMMQLHPEDRYQNGSELLYALQHIYELDDEYKTYLIKRRSLKITVAILWMSGFFLIAFGILMRGRELNISYNRNVEAADMAIEAGEFGTAQVNLEKAKSMLPYRIDAYVKESLLLYQRGDYEGCIRYISDILQNPVYTINDENAEKSLAEIYYIAGNSFMELEDYSNALLHLKEAIGLDPNNSIYYRDYVISLAKEGNIKEAESWLEKAENLGLGEDSIYMVEGELNFVQKKYNEAQRYLEQAIRTSTNDELRKRAVLLYDDAYRELGDSYLDEEIMFLEQEENRVSGSKSGMNLTERLADAYARKAKIDIKNQQEYYQKALEKFLYLYENGYATRQMMENIAIIYQALGEYEQAEQMLFSMADQYQDSYISYKRLAFLEAEKQQVKENQDRNYNRMKEYYDRAKELYGDQDTDQEMQMLENLIQDLRDGNWL